MKTITPKIIYQVRVSGLESKILEEACRPWGIFCGFGGIDGRSAFIDKDKVDIVIRALKIHQVEYTVASKKRKRTKSLITQIEQVRSANNDK
jgi:hypothetical protein